MLSVVLPLLALAIALTPVVVSARELYERELHEQNRSVDSGEGHMPHRSGIPPQSERVGTIV